MAPPTAPGRRYGFPAAGRIGRCRGCCRVAAARCRDTWRVGRGERAGCHAAACLVAWVAYGGQLHLGNLATRAQHVVATVDASPADPMILAGGRLYCASTSKNLASIRDYDIADRQDQVPGPRGLGIRIRQRPPYLHCADSHEAHRAARRRHGPALPADAPRLLVHVRRPWQLACGGRHHRLLQPCRTKAGPRYSRRLDPGDRGRRRSSAGTLTSPTPTPHAMPATACSPGPPMACSGSPTPPPWPA